MTTAVFRGIILVKKGEREMINFDMDGTIADLYGIRTWKEDLTAEKTTPYEIAKPLVNMSRLAKALHKAQRNGEKIAVITWTAKAASRDYEERTATAKRKWLAKHLPSVKWDKIIIVPYGTPKTECGEGILFDDNEKIRAAWGEGAYTPNEIFKVLA